MNKWLAALAFIISMNSIANTRIVTIGGDVSEITYALGAGERIVARDSTSLNPAPLRDLPDVGYMRLLNIEGILAIKPTLILSTERAASSRALTQLTDLGIQLVYVPADKSPEGVIDKIQLIATTLGQEAQGQQLIQHYQQQLATVVSTPLPVKVLFVMSHAGIPPLAAGLNTAADSMFKAVGLNNAIQEFKGYRPLSQEGIIASAPDLLIVTTHGVKSLNGVENVWRLPGMAQTPAGKHQRLLVLDDIALLGFGLQTPEILKQLRAAAESI
ncbi:hemin-binding periplasmic protein hmuT [Yersinia rohdei]|uniref:Hemin-binding periplasmic protein n=1 Tax=Yersinia rohdei TaxID=29485 RepID=A0A0U1HPA6_YERRO|nr:ABC transporter substrate-binding protein [Yersinia rohdei]AJJ12412.1 hemin-binding periplasmic protein hmuT [Yersinia rohdei]MDN0095815.1 ABC transporter substrate-binding protein [Yersinia rohdei]OWF78248.1 hemin ABC transporter substrate-binding protein [Yersinia rohdei]CNI35627.1 hemin-binding periplasmic protein [Yersinia rohdei]CQI88357.1 hemin-binding periplasmic protein [Yersinia rohdei]